MLKQKGKSKSQLRRTFQPHHDSFFKKIKTITYQHADCGGGFWNHTWLCVSLVGRSTNDNCRINLHCFFDPPISFTPSFYCYRKVHDPLPICNLDEFLPVPDQTIKCGGAMFFRLLSNDLALTRFWIWVWI